MPRTTDENKEHFCIRCHHHWTGGEPVEYCGDCHRACQEATSVSRRSVPPRKELRQAFMAGWNKGQGYSFDFAPGVTSVRDQQFNAFLKSTSPPQEPSAPS